VVQRVDHLLHLLTQSILAKLAHLIAQSILAKLAHGDQPWRPLKWLLWCAEGRYRASEHRNMPLNAPEHAPGAPLWPLSV